MFTVTVAGQYYAEGKKVKKYQYECKLPKMDSALSVIKGKIEARKMPQLYDDFKGVRTRSIVDVKSDIGLPANPETEKISEMTLDQLHDFVLAHELPIDSSKYTDIVVLRKDISDAVANLTLFLKKKEAKEKQSEADKELDDLNPDLKDPDEINAGDANPIGDAPGAPVDRGAQLPTGQDTIPEDPDPQDPPEPVDPLAGLK